MLTVLENVDYQPEADQPDNISHRKIIGKSAPMQTIVEVINPTIVGDGMANEIPIGRSVDCGDQYSLNDDEDEFSSIGGFEPSLNDKMKNVLKELLGNERVKLNLSRSLNEDDQSGKEEDEFDDDDVDGNIRRSDKFNDNFILQFGNSDVKSDECDTNKNFSLSTNPIAVVSVDCTTAHSTLVYQNPNVDFHDDFQSDKIIAEKLSEKDEKLKEKLLSELHVNDGRKIRKDDDNETADSGAGGTAEMQDDESFHEVSAVETATIMTESSKSTNNGKKKKRKGKNKKK